MTFDLTQHLKDQSPDIYYAVYEGDKFIKAFDTRKEAKDYYDDLVADFDGTTCEKDHETGGFYSSQVGHDYRIEEECEV